MSGIAATSSFSGKCVEVFSNTDNIVEGALWCSLCGMSITGWFEASGNRSKVDPNLSPEAKADALWNANKGYILANFSLASGLSMVFSWLHQVELLSLGPLAGVVGATGYGGSGVVQSVKCLSALGELWDLINPYFAEQDVKMRSQIGLDAINILIKIAFLASFAAWGILGMAWSLQGGTALFMAQDTAFYYFFITGMAHLASNILVIPLLKKLP